MRGYVLAGGLSRRFGTDKALFEVEGVPLVLRVAEVLKVAGLEPWLISREPRNLGIPELYDGVCGSRHPLWGVAAGLAAGEALFCPCDLGELQVSQIQRLLRSYQPPGVVASGQPLLGIFSADLRHRAKQIATQEGPVRQFVEGLPTIDLGSLPNWNRPPTGPQTEKQPAFPEEDPTRSGNQSR